ncbi:hypothetical protein CEXT_548131 [Caerostris extrusa]|uniref:Ycf15 n=1 Tax=Caerostris extrusa TaxID=172846 RepID=A0AAV4YA58_CAEEX|nr:hypothetical protein CEXT_548131 [Caerostris extrusa]
MQTFSEYGLRNFSNDSLRSCPTSSNQTHYWLLRKQHDLTEEQVLLPQERLYIAFYTERKQKLSLHIGGVWWQRKRKIARKFRNSKLSL